MTNGRKKFELNGIIIKKNLLSKKNKIKIKNVIYDAFKPYIKFIDQLKRSLLWSN